MNKLTVENIQSIWDDSVIRLIFLDKESWKEGEKIMNMNFRFWLQDKPGCDMYNVIDIIQDTKINDIQFSSTIKIILK